VEENGRRRTLHDVPPLLDPKLERADKKDHETEDDAIAAA
jgi:hypothetical protein